MDSSVGVRVFLVGKIVAVVGFGVKGLIGVGLPVYAVVGILLLRLLVGADETFGAVEKGT